MAGRGSIEKRGKDSYRLVYRLGFNQDGKPIKKTKTVHVKNGTLAKKELAKFVTEIEAGEYIDPSKMKFADFVDEWRNKYGEKHLSSRTLEHHEFLLKGNILPTFGNMRIDQVKAIHILNYLDSLEKDGARRDGKPGGLSSSTINQNYQLLKDIFDRATEWKVIKNSPIDGVKRPKVRYAKFDVYDEDEAYILFDKLQDAPDTWRIYFTLALTAGLRRGELLGLQKDNIHPDQGTIDIKHQLRRTKAKGFELTAPKKDSIRTVAIPPYVMEELKKYLHKKNKERMEAAELWEGGEHFFVFSTWNGKPFYPDVPRKWWKRFTDKAGIKYIRPHDFRHTSATLLINKGIHAKVIAQRLGHADIRTTMNIYGHVYDKADAAAANEFNSLFEPQKKTKKA